MAKPKVAFFDFASCEGCQLQVANLEEDIIAVAELVDIVEFREVITGKAPERNGGTLRIGFRHYLNCI